MKRNSYDVIVVGSGAAGLTAACTAAALGRQVLLLEGSDRVGGTTAISGGMVWIPANHKMLEEGMEDSAEAARAYLRATVRGSEHDPRMAAFLARGDEAIRFLEQRTEVRLRPVWRYPDYYPELQGATVGGRVLEPVPFDGLELGAADFELLRDPLPEFLLFGGMMIGREDIPVLRRVGRSPRAAWHATKLLGRYAAQRLRAHRGTTLVLGNALVARLLKSARRLNVEIRAGSTAIALHGDARVTGLSVRCGSTALDLTAREAVILATGGISHHAELRSSYVPTAAGQLSATVRTGASCSGVHLARSFGAQLSSPCSGVDDALAFWVPVSTFARPDGSSGVFPHTVTDRAKPGLIAVNLEGRRFVNEAVSYHEFVRAQLRDSARPSRAWLICDSHFLWKYGLGRVRPFALSTKAERASGYLRRAATLEALADQIGVPDDALVATVRRYNERAKYGEDPEFGRGANVYQRHLGDAEQQPNPCVAPLEHEPFYAVEVQPADLGMAAGLVTDAHARVLREGGTPIPGLYACGNDMHSVMGGDYPAPGITLGPALVFGYLAAMHGCGAAAAAAARRTYSPIAPALEGNS